MQSRGDSEAEGRLEVKQNQKLMRVRAEIQSQEPEKLKSQRAREPEGRQSQRTVKRSNDQAISNVRCVLNTEEGIPEIVNRLLRELVQARAQDSSEH